MLSALVPALIGPTRNSEESEFQAAFSQPLLSAILTTKPRRGDQVPSGVFRLHSESKNAWEKWSPRIRFGAHSNPSASGTKPAEEAKLVHHEGDETGNPNEPEKKPHRFLRLLHHGES